MRHLTACASVAARMGVRGAADRIAAPVVVGAPGPDPDDPERTAPWSGAPAWWSGTGTSGSPEPPPCTWSAERVAPAGRVAHPDERGASGCWRAATP
jgi:hypothetical protein